jgi:hypothetical protein
MPFINYLRDGKITKVEWANALNSVMTLSVPWLKLQPFLADTDHDGNINYTIFLERYQLYSQSVLGDSWQESIIEKICTKIFEASGDLVAEFKKYDRDGGIYSHINTRSYYYHKMEKCPMKNS